MKTKHIYLFSCFNMACPSTRYRGVYVLKELSEKFNVTSSFIYPSYKPRAICRFLLSYLSILLELKKDSIIIFQKLHSNGIYVRLLKLLLKIKPSRIIYDTDDADYLRYDKKNIDFFMKNSVLCTVGSQALVNRAKKFNNGVSLLTSPIIEHGEVKTKRNETFTIGWVGDYGYNFTEHCHSVISGV